MRSRCWMLRSLQKWIVSIHLTLACIALAGCGVRGDDVALKDELPDGYHQLNRGVPVLLGASAAAVQFTDGIGVTVAHNRVVIRGRLWRHPTHDIAFFKLDKAVPEWSDAAVGDTIIAYGSSNTRRNRTLETEVVVTDGAFWYDPGDSVYITREGFSSGMSGGPVFNKQGAAVGIVLGTVTSDPDPDHPLFGKVRRRNGIFIPTRELEVAFREMCADLEFMHPCDLKGRPGGHTD